ncbi:MAG: arsenate reductase ArsC [Planctomycetota bacterium]|nr:arsenate reductase ArsC [Planctomycetota bacterium]
MGDRKPRVLFLCTGNACRSQMAEGWAKRLHGDRYEIHSAGLVAHGQNPRAVEAMDALGIDIRGQQSKPLTALAELEFDVIVTVCDHAAEHVPALQGAPQVVHQPFPDPPAVASQRAATEEEACYREVATAIGDWVQALPDLL